MSIAIVYVKKVEIISSVNQNYKVFSYSILSSMLPMRNVSVRSSKGKLECWSCWGNASDCFQLAMCCFSHIIPLSYIYYIYIIYIYIIIYTDIIPSPQSPMFLSSDHEMTELILMIVSAIF